MERDIKCVMRLGRVRKGRPFKHPQIEAAYYEWLAVNAPRSAYDAFKAQFYAAIARNVDVLLITAWVAAGRISEFCEHNRPAVRKDFSGMVDEAIKDWDEMMEEEDAPCAALPHVIN